LAESGEYYTIDRTLSENGINQNVYHGKCLIGPHIQKLLDDHTKVIKKMETQFLGVCVLRMMEKNPGADCASIKERKGSSFRKSFFAMISAFRFREEQEASSTSKRLKHFKVPSIN
jgi:hypothetical protein